MEEQILSQKLSQLSNSHHANELLNTISKNLEDNIPHYLSQESKSFEQLLEQASLKSNSIEELRQLAIRIYQISIIDLQKMLWTTYWKAGTGKLKSNHQTNDDHHISPSLWPIEIQRMMKERINKTDDASCLAFVTEHLSALDKEINQYQSELMIQKNQWFNYIQIIETFVRQGLEPIRMEIEHQIALVQYNYNDYVLELEYLRYNPTQYQVNEENFLLNKFLISFI